MADNRKSRRATASIERKNGQSTAERSDAPTLTDKDKRRISAIQAEIVNIERGIAQLDLEQEKGRALWRQKRAELQTVCQNALRGQGIDLEDPATGRWSVNPETMVVERVPMPNELFAGP